MHRVAHTFSCTLLSEKKESLPDKAYFYFAFASNMSKIASGTESLRAEHRGNDPRNWPLYFQCPCRHIRHDLYMIHKQSVDKEQSKSTRGHRTSEKKKISVSLFLFEARTTLTPSMFIFKALQKGGVPAAPSGTATLLRLSPNHQFRPRPTLAVTDFRHPRLSWLDGRCVQGPGTYSPRHG